MSLSAPSSPTSSPSVPVGTLLIKAVLRFAMNIFVATSNVILTFVVAVVVIIAVTKLLRLPAFSEVINLIVSQPLVFPLVAILFVALIGLFPRIRYFVGNILVGIWIVALIDVVAKTDYGPISGLPKDNWYVSIVLVLLGSIILLAPKASELAHKKGWF